MAPKSKADTLRAQARVRMRNQRARDRAKRLPSAREIDKAIRTGLVLFLREQGVSSRISLKANATAHRICALAFAELPRAQERFTAEGKAEQLAQQKAIIARFIRRLGIQ